MAKKDGALDVRARFEADEQGGLPPGEVVAYAFSDSGKLLDAQPLKDGAAKLRVPIADEPAPARVLIGPRVPDDVPVLDELLRRGAFEEHVRLEPKLRPLDVLILPHDWLCWFLSRCTVRGTLLKRVERGGVTVDLPVCNADVEIYEVDPLPVLIPKLPDHILDRIRDIVLERPPFPFPEPDPDPFFPPGPRPGPDPSPLIGVAHAGHAEPAARAKSAPAPAELRQAVELATSRDQLRQVLLANPLIVRPLICHLFPTLVTKTLIGTARTDECGHFRHTFFRGCNNPDQPDLWFKATQEWFFGTLTVYNPLPVACHTWWNYVCGTEVTLYTTNPLALTCPPCGPVVAPDNFVMVWGIGRHSAHAIHGASADLPSTPALRGLTSDGRPFAGMLRLRLDFDSSLRNTLGIRYYRVSWRAAGGTFQPLLGECHRHYKVESATGLTIVGYPLGPNVVGTTAGLFEIPPALPPEGDWTQPDPVEDTTNAKFPSHLLVPGVPPESATDNAGVHELKIELFDAAGAAGRRGGAGRHLGRAGRRRPQHAGHVPRRGARGGRDPGRRVRAAAARRQQPLRGEHRRADARRLGRERQLRRDALRPVRRRGRDAVPRRAPQRLRDALVHGRPRRRRSARPAERVQPAGDRRRLHADGDGRPRSAASVRSRRSRRTSTSRPARPTAGAASPGWTRRRCGRSRSPRRSRSADGAPGALAFGAPCCRSPTRSWSRRRSPIRAWSCCVSVSMSMWCRVCRGRSWRGGSGSITGS